MDQLVLAIITILFIIAVIFILLGTEKHHKHLKKAVSLQDSTIKSLRDENRALHEKVESKERYIVNLAANNAVMKQRVVELESHINTDKYVIESAVKLGLKIKINYEERSFHIDAQPLIDKIKNEQLTSLFKAKPLRSQEQTIINKTRIVKGATSKKPKNKTTKKNKFKGETIFFKDGKATVNKKTAKAMSAMIADPKPLKKPKKIKNEN